jgi:hypothetical protein
LQSLLLAILHPTAVVEAVAAAVVEAVAAAVVEAVAAAAVVAAVVAVCCNQQVTNKSSLFSTLTGILDIPIGNVIGSLGLDCTVGLIALYCGICCLVSLLQSVNILGSSNTCGTTTNVVQCNSSGNSGMYLIYGSNATAFKLLMTFIGLLGLIGIGCVPIVA